MNRQDSTTEPAIRSAVAMLDGIRKRPAKSIIKDGLKRLAGRRTAPHDIIFWPAGLILLGLSELSDVLSETGDPADKKLSVMADMAAAAHLERWLDTGSRMPHLDDCLSGAAMVMLSGRECLSDGFTRKGGAIDSMYDLVTKQPKDLSGCPIYNSLSGNDYVFADGAGETAVFLSVYSAARDCSEAASYAAHILSGYLENGIDERTGLPYHAYSMKEGMKLGITGWGRAAGWLMLGLRYYLEYVSDPDPAIRARYDELTRIILSYRRDDGLFPWALTCPEGHPDSSASCMLARAIPEAASDTVSAVIKGYLTEAGQVTSALDACEDLAVHRQRYGVYPWGQGAFLLALSESLA